MKNRIIVDEVNITETFGFTPIKGWLNGVVTPPVLKKFRTINWKDEDGVQCDTSNPCFDVRTFSLPFYCKSTEFVDAFFDFIHLQSTHIWHFEDIDRSLSLRVTAQSQIKTLEGGWWFTLAFTEDIPYANYTYVPPVSTSTTIQGYKIDMYDLSYYGVKLLKGYEEEVYKQFPIKENVAQSSSDRDGIIYPNQRVFKNMNSVKLPILICGEHALGNMEALVWHLSRSKERVFTDTIRALQCNCIYKSVEIKDFESDWLQANINLDFTSIFKHI